MKTLIYNIVFVSVFACSLQQQTQAQMHSSEAEHSDHAITILTEDYAYQAPDQIPSGWTTIEFENHVVNNPEQGVGHNVHIARVDDDTQVEEVLRWINFAEIDGLRTPGPYTIAGGMHLMPAGETAYFTTELETGQLFGQSQQIVVNVEAMDHAFEVDAPDDLPTGWITFVLNNQMAQEVHEISFARLPEGVTYDEYLTDYMGAWETLLIEYQQGIVERDEIGTRVNELLPAWASDIEYVNARGLISPGRTAEKTVYLEPGKYTMGCWMKTEDGIIHIVQGMHQELNITEEPANSPEPNPEARLTLHEEDIEVDWRAETGKHAFAVDFSTDQDGRSFHNNMHLIRLEGETNWVELNNWLDWYHPGGLRSPSPADYLGGFGTDRDGATVYFSLEITDPGEYAWVVFASQGQGLYKTFTID